MEERKGDAIDQGSRIKGNSFWKLRSKHGRPKIFSTPEILKKEAFKYFAFCDDNPLQEEKVLADGSKVNVNLMRAYTRQGLEYFLKIGNGTWENYKSRKEFKEVIEEIEQVIYNQKFQGAAAGLLNANIISRDLGLVDKQTMELSKAPPRDYSMLTDEELQLLAHIENKMLNGKEAQYLPGTV
jgi:hypothetical protein